jgi:hypothetical protein
MLAYLPIHTLARTIQPGTFWEKSDPVIDSSGHVIRGGMWPTARRWWDLPNFIKVAVAGYGWGKSLTLAKRMISLGLQNSPCPVAVVSPTFVMARRTMVPTISEYLEGKRQHYGRQLWWKYNRGYHEFQVRFRGRSFTLYILSGENPDSLRGPNLAAFGGDEIFLMDESVFHQMVARVRHPDAVHREIPLVGTPEQLNWGHSLCNGDMKEKHDVGFVQASTAENKALDPGYIGRLAGSFSGKAYEAYVEGQFRNLASGVVYYAYDPEQNDREEDLPAGAELGAGMDFNARGLEAPMCSAVFWVFGNHIHFFDEVTLPNSDTESMCAELKARYWDKGLRKIYPDPSGKARQASAKRGVTSFKIIEEAGFDVFARSRAPTLIDRYNSTNAKLRARDGRVTLTISKNCRRLREYLSAYSHELMMSQKHMPHMLDAFSYPVELLFPIIRRFGGGMDVDGF